MPKSSQNEGKLLIAINTLNCGQIKSGRKAASLYDVPPSTLNDRVNGRKSRAEINAKKRKLRPHEHEALVAWCLDMDKRGFPTQLIQVREMADALLAARKPGKPFENVGKCWATRFIRDEPRLAMKWNTYNFDETGFMMGISSTAKASICIHWYSAHHKAQPIWLLIN
jgi:hypothetical protein